MTTTTSYSNAGRFRPLYGSLLKRNAGYFGMISVLIFLFYPVQYALEITKTPPEWWVAQNAELMATAANVEQSIIPSFYSLLGYGKNYTEITAVFYTAIMIVMPIVLALMLNSYMHSKKAADVFHSLPIRREALLLANAAVAMTMLAVPVVLSNIAIAVMSTVKFGWHPQMIGAQMLDMVGWLACALAIYAITTLASVLSGTVFDSLIYTGMMLFSLPAVCGIYMVLCSAFLYGYSASTEMMANLFYFSPTFIMVTRMVNAEGGTMVSGVRDLLANNIAIAAYLVLGVALLVLTARLYRNRRSELAEMTGYVGPLPLATKLVGTLICGILTGTLFYSMNNNSKTIYVLWAIIGGMVAYVILEVILSRGFKHLVKSLPVGAAMIAFTVISSAAIMNGGFGYETRVPDVQKVASVKIYGLTSPNNTQNGGINMQTGEWEWSTEVVLSELQNIQTVVDFHTDAVTRHLSKDSEELDETQRSQIYQWINVEYQLKNGSRVKRQYYDFSPQTVENLSALQFTPEFLKQEDQTFRTPPANVTEWKISNPFGSEVVRPTLTSEETTGLLEAMQADVLARTPETITARPVAWVSWTMQYQSNIRTSSRAGETRYAGNNFSVLVSDVNTLTFLRQKNLLDSLEPDWSKCTAVSLSSEMQYNNRGDRGIYRAITPENLYLTQERARINTALRDREQALAYAEDGVIDGVVTTIEQDGFSEVVVTEKSEQYYWSPFLLETPEEIAAVNESVVGIATIDQRLLEVIFFFEGSETGLPVLVNYDTLPETIKAKCRTMWGEGFEKNLAMN